jgi:hypothetical protein
MYYLSKIMPSQVKMKPNHPKHSVNTTKVENRKILNLTKKTQKSVQNFHTLCAKFAHCSQSLYFPSLPKGVKRGIVVKKQHL